MASLPGASLPWPEGVFGLLTMAALSVLTLAMVLLALRPRVAADLLFGLHRRMGRSWKGGTRWLAATDATAAPDAGAWLGATGPPWQA